LRSIAGDFQVMRRLQNIVVSKVSKKVEDTCKRKQSPSDKFYCDLLFVTFICHIKSKHSWSNC